MRLIDADALKEQIPETRADIFENCRNCKLLDASEVLGIIDEAPTIETITTEEQVNEYCRKRCLVVVSSELFNEMKGTVKHGHWIDCKFQTTSTCSNCGECWNWYDNDMETFNYCPSCGAKMDAPTQKSVGKALKALEEQT